MNNTEVTKTEKYKLTYINSLETQIKKEAEISDKPKYFITFPYPYMNGKLHLGHLFSVSKSDFMAHYKEMAGYNVLFPLSFHCTGMPISASAKKLKEELEGKKPDISVKKILEELGFEDVTPFTDPLHWVRTFPKYCRESLQKFGANIDWRRSFVTTSLNGYYDSFVRWQFYNLKRKGYISFGKRVSIYCPIDNQACLDHDRRKGENVKPVNVFLYKMHDQERIILVRHKQSGNVIDLTVGKNLELILFKVKNQEYIAEELIFNNLKYQVADVVYLKNIKLAECISDTVVFDKQSIPVNIIEQNIFAVRTSHEQVQKYDDEIKELESMDYETQEDLEKINLSVKQLEIKTATAVEPRKEDTSIIQTSNFISVYIPESEVISRSGAVCVVSPLDQWYLNYNDQEWKNKVKLCISRMEIEEDTRAKLLEGVDWISKWGLSRSFGLGTRVPWDEQYLIESLSDSTIYMAMYTFKHIMYKDLEGQEEIFPKKKLCPEVWDYIFRDIELPSSLQEYSTILQKCRESFRYFYPVDLRVSGKDLIKNHLLFFLFNHVAIFEEKYWPKRIYTNGHLMLNSEKMSKSTGNYLTVDETLEKYGPSATRMCLAVCGDSNEDANFVEANANSYIIKLYNFIKNIEEVESIGELDLSNLNNTDIYMLEMISQHINECIRAYEEMKYSDVIKYGFFELTHLGNFYKMLKGNNMSLIKYSYKVMVQLLYPIIPDLARTLIEKYFNSEFNLPKPIYNTTKMISSITYIQDLSRRISITKAGRSKKQVKIQVSKKYPAWKEKIMKYIDSLDIERSEKIKSDNEAIIMVLKEIVPIILEYDVNAKKANIFAVEYLVNPQKFKIAFNELEIINEYKFYIQENTNKEVVVEENESGEPLLPNLIFN